MTTLRFPVDLAVGELWWEAAREPEGSTQPGDDYPPRKSVLTTPQAFPDLGWKTLATILPTASRTTAPADMLASTKG